MELLYCRVLVLAYNFGIYYFSLTLHTKEKVFPSATGANWRRKGLFFLSSKQVSNVLLSCFTMQKYAELCTKLHIEYYC